MNFTRPLLSRVNYSVYIHIHNLPSCSADYHSICVCAFFWHNGPQNSQCCKNNFISTNNFIIYHELPYLHDIKKKPSIWSTSIFLNPIQGFLLTNSKFLRYMCSCFIPNPYSLVKRWSLENGHCVMVGGTGSLSLSLPFSLFCVENFSSDVTWLTGNWTTCVKHMLHSEGNCPRVDHLAL